MIQTKSKSIKYSTEFSNGTDVSHSDTTLEKGGANSGFRPHELLEAALASCMNISLKMCAENMRFLLEKLRYRFHYKEKILSIQPLNIMLNSSMNCHKKRNPYFLQHWKNVLFVQHYQSHYSFLILLNNNTNFLYGENQL